MIRQFVKEHPVQASFISLLFILNLRNASEKQILEATQALQEIIEHIEDTQEALTSIEQFLSKEFTRSKEEAQVENVHL